MQFLQTPSLHWHKNAFSLLFGFFSRKVVDPASGEFVLLFKTKLNFDIIIYADAAKTVPLLTLKHTNMKEGKLNLGWDVLDSEKGDQVIGHLPANHNKRYLNLGMGGWTMTSPSGDPLLTLKSGSRESASKYMMDKVLSLYNPSHAYTLVNAQGNEVAYLTTKHGVLKFFYDLQFEPKISETDRKAAVAFFAVMSLNLIR